MKAIVHNGELVAFANGPNIKLDPNLDALAHDHPDRRWAIALATFACLVETGQQPGPYTPDGAARFARDLLLPLPGFLACIGSTDPALALLFNLPLDQVRERRTELGLGRN